MIVHPVPTPDEVVHDRSTVVPFTTVTTFQYPLYALTLFHAIFTRSFTASQCVADTTLRSQFVGVALVTAFVTASTFSFAIKKATSNIHCPLTSFSIFTIAFDSIQSFVLFGTIQYVLCTTIFVLSEDDSHQPFLFSIVTDLYPHTWSFNVCLYTDPSSRDEISADVKDHSNI